MPLKFIKKSASMPGERRGNDPDYEEVGPVSIRIAATTEVRGNGRHCEVCGAAQAAVRCDSCSGQVFCAACDDVFHRHPRRTQHIRKGLEGTRPPLPPKAGEAGQTVLPPQPPPRRNKRTFLGGGGFSRKDQSNSVESAGGEGGGRTIMGSLKRFMGSRPLPPPPGAAHNRGDTSALGSGGGGNLIRSITSPNLANDKADPMLTVAIPQTVVDLSTGGSSNSGMGGRKYTAPAPPSQSNNPAYPALLPRPPSAPSHGHQRKMSLQQAPSQRDEKRQSMVDGGCWDAQGRYRSQSVSDEQWSQLLAAQGHVPAPPPPLADPSTNQRSRFNTVGGNVANNRAGPGRGMMSSASVCDLNTLAQQQPQNLHQQQHMQQHQMMPHMGGMHQSGSFQQLNMVPYTGGMMWAPTPCDMCHAPPPMYPPLLPSHGMKRAASNISMNMSSASSDVTGYPWQPHMHHHMGPPMYPGYYPQPSPHMMPNSMQGSSISIPDSMAAFSKVSSSPAPSVRSSSRRSHKSSKSRSFSTADLSRRTRSSHRSESDDSTTSSPSVEEELHNSSAKPGYPGGPLAWQCDHCTFINQPGSRMCGMCSKTPGAGTHQRTNRRVSERRRSEHSRFVQRRNNENDEYEREPSDYENDGKHNNIHYNNNNRDNRRDKSLKTSTQSRNKKKLRKRAGSSGSASDVVEELERQLSDMKVSKSRGPEYEGVSARLKERERDKDRERGSRKREGQSGRYKLRSKNASERSRTPGRPSPEESQSAQGSPRDDSPQDDEVFAAFQSEEKKPENNHSNSNEGTLVGPGNSDETILVTEYRKTKSDSRIRRGKSAVSSRASTPGPGGEIHHAAEEILPVINLMEVVKPLNPKPQTDYLDLPKPKEKSPSPFRQNSHPDTAEEPSFANTLDDIATMGTNEVADLDLYMDDRSLSALPVNIDDIEHFIPTARYVDPLSQNEVKETALISEHEEFLVDEVHSTSIKVEFSQGIKQVDLPEEVQAVPEPQIKPTDRNSKGDHEPEVDIEQQADISAQPFENAAQTLEKPQNEMIEDPVDDKAREAEFAKSGFTEEANDGGETSEYETNDEGSKILEVSQVHHSEEPHEPSPNRGSLENINIRPSTSFASLTGLGSMPRDRQFTPLSFSSSDAAFYSPADSPDESLEEKLKDRPSESQTQLKPRTAAERANIQRSPSFQKKTGGREDGPSRRASPEGGYLSSDAYEGLSFQDALSGHADFYGLQRSASDQMVAKEVIRSPEEYSPKGGRRWLPVDEASLSVEEMIARRKQESMKRDGLQLVQVLREAEKAGYRAEEVSVALPLCGDRGPLQWLSDNWWTMVETVRTLASNYGREKQQNNIGEISEQEARAALRAHRGNIWAAVTESVEQRQAKFAAVCARGDFDPASVSRALQITDGDVDAACRELMTGETSDSDFYHSFQPDDIPILSQHAEDDACSQLYANCSNASTVSGALYHVTKPNRSSMHPNPPPTQQPTASIRFRRPSPPPNPLQPDDDSSVYSNIVSSPNLILVAKTEALLQELEDEAPMLSRDLKLKIVKAILDEEPNSAIERQQIDSDEESTIEELLAREQNPSFYEYFTAVDLDEEGEDYQERRADLDEEGEDYQERRAEDSVTSETASAYMAQIVTANYDREVSVEHAASLNYENHEPAIVVPERGRDKQYDMNDNDRATGDYENHEPAIVVPEKRGRDKQYDMNDNDRATGDSAVYGNVIAIVLQEKELSVGPSAATAAVVRTPSTSGLKRREEVVNNTAAPDAAPPGATATLTAAAAAGASAAQPEDMLYVRKEDVVLHPLKAFTHYADLSTSNYSDAADYPGSSWGGEAAQTRNTRATSASVKPNDRMETDPFAPSVSSQPRPPSISTTNADILLQDGPKRSVRQGIVTAAETSTDITKTSTPTVNTRKLMREKEPQPLENETNTLATEVLRSSVTYEGGSSDEGDEESVSVTTGRLSLTLSHSSDKDGAIDVTAATVQREDVQTELTPRVRTPVGAGGSRPDGIAEGGAQSARATGTTGKAQSSVKRKTDIRHIATLEQQEQKLKVNDPDASADSLTGDESILELVMEDKIPQAEAEVAPEEAIAPSGLTDGDKEDKKAVPEASVAPKQPPVKKASTIIGKAIAKAMARESTVKEGSIGREGSPGSGGIYSPEPDDYSSRASTPASLTQDSTVASSSQLDSADSTPVSTTPASNTPRSTPDLTEDVSATMQEAVDSEDEELLRTLDTIPEEEEISERTESGRVVSRASSRNVRLPFHPTSEVRLWTPTALKPTIGNVLTGTSSGGATIKQAATPSIEIKVPVISSCEVDDKPPADAGDGADSDHYQDSRLSERSDDNPEEDSDSSTPHQVDIDGDDNSLALIPQPATDVILPDDHKDNQSAVDDHKIDQCPVYDHSKAFTSQSTHHYYNTAGQRPQKNTYYNDSAATALAREQETIQVDLNDYESMYSIKRELDQLRQSSSEVSEKINNLGTRNRTKGPVKNIGPAKELKSALKASASTSALQVKEAEELDTPSSPLTGAQMLAEESASTIKRSPKNSSLAKSTTTPDVALERRGSTEQTNAQQTAKTKVAKEKASKPEPDYNSASDQTDGSKSHEDDTVVQNTSSTDETGRAQKKPGTATAAAQPSFSNKGTEVKRKSSLLKPVTDSTPDIAEYKVYAPAKPKQVSTESKSNVSESRAQTSATLTVKSKTPTPASAVRKTELRSLGSGPSAFSAPASVKKTPVEFLPVMDSSGESEDEDKPVNAQRVSLERHQLLPNLLSKMESLKGREPDFQEVQELKQEIADLKKSLQSQMCDDDRGHDTKSPLPRIRVQSGAGTPTINVENPPAGEGEEGGKGLLKPKTEEESTQYEQLRFDRTVRRLLAEGQAGSYEKAELAAHLLSLSFDEEDSIAAAQECSSIYGALHFLQQDCELCAEKFPMKNMVSMLYCTHRCCIGCAKTYFTYQIKTKNIRELRCPFCNEPNIDTSEESMDEYFNHLDILLKGIVDEETHELFQRKLRDLTLMSDPNFRWCNKCSSGFIANPRVRKLICPDCKDVTCAHCRLPWEAQHEGISCDAFAKWKHENDPEAQAQGVAKHLAENGITCPKCRFQYSLAKGGCMHFTCTECKYEFCSGCGQPFRQGAKCPVGPYCERLGLHAHHPRNCLFYLRDKDPPQLQQLLKENNVPFDTEPREEEQRDPEKRKHCQVAEQKEMPEGLVDDICGRAVLQGYAGLCRLHYVEYLVEKINSHHLDPVIIFDEADLRVCLRRNGKAVPIRRWESEKLYRDKLIKLIKEQLPL